MKKRLFSTALALVLVLSIFTACGNGNNKKTVIAKIENREVYLEDFMDNLEYLLYIYGVDATSSSARSYVDAFAESTFQTLVLSETVIAKGEELGLDTLTDDEKQEIKDNVVADIDSARTSYEGQIKEENPDATDAEINMLVNVELANAGYTDEELTDYYTESVIYEKVYAHVTDALAITDDEVKESYDKAVESAKESYTENPSGYESAVGSSTVYYTPAGARRVKHILIGFSDEVRTELQTLYYEDEDAYEALLKEKLAEIEPEAQAMLDSIIKEEADFDAIMEEKSTDPGLATFPDGYVLAEGGTTYEESFSKAALALQNVGDLSGLISTSNGYHILRLEELLEEGPVDFETVKDELAATALDEKKNAVFYDTVSAWKEEMNVTEYPERYKSHIDEIYPVDSATSPSANASTAPSSSDDSDKNSSLKQQKRYK